MTKIYDVCWWKEEIEYDRYTLATCTVWRYIDRKGEVRAKVSPGGLYYNWISRARSFVTLEAAKYAVEKTIAGEPEALLHLNLQGLDD